MKQGKFSGRKPARRGNKRITAILLALALLLTIGVVGTIAYIQTSTQDVANTFTPGKVPPVINESHNGTTKTNVSVTNNGNVAAYIRVAVAATWRDAEGNIAPFNAVENTDYQITFPENCKWVWVENENENSGYYYYPEQRSSYGCCC